MLHSIVVHPEFFRSIKDNDDLQKHFEGFYKEIKHKAKDILFRVDDKNETLKKEYNEIIKNITPGDYLKTLIEDFFLKQLYVEKINIDFETSNLDRTINNLKFINFYFSKVTDIQKRPVFRKDYYPLNKLKKDSFENLVIELTRFAKKITFADPYIAQRMTNLWEMPFIKCQIENVREKINKIKMGKSPEDFKIQINKINNDYKVSLKKLLDIIYKNNIFIDQLEIEILTSIRKPDIKKIKDNLAQINDLHDKEEDKDKKDKYFNLKESFDKELHLQNIKDKILFSLADTSRPKSKLKIKFVNQYDDEYEGAQFYVKSLIIKGDEKETVVDVGKGLNFYTDIGYWKPIKPNGQKYEKKPTQIKKENAYILELVKSAKKERYTTPTRFEIFDSKSFRSMIEKYFSTYNKN